MKVDQILMIYVKYFVITYFLQKNLKHIVNMTQMIILI